MSKKKNTKVSKNSKRKQEKRAFRKALEKKAKGDIRRYMASRRVPSGELPKQVVDETHSLSDEIVFPHCDGVGECCKNRPLFLEPTDVYRIMHNERAIDKYNLVTTMDLYGKGDTPGILHYQYDTNVMLPFCVAVRAPLEKIVPDDVSGLKFVVEPDDQACPFLEFGEDGIPCCVLGDDRPTQCSTDPVVRASRVPEGRRLMGWKYILIKNICDGCLQALPELDRKETVASWLLKNDVEMRFVESDIFHGFIEWMQFKTSLYPETREFLWKMAASMVFDWHRFAIEHLGQPQDEVIANGPDTPRRVVESARMLVEGMIEGGEKLRKEKDADTDKGSSPED